MNTLRLRSKLVLIFLGIFFPISLMRLVHTIIRGWNSFFGELSSGFPLISILKNYNPSLYEALRLFPRSSPWFLGTQDWLYGPVHHFWLFPLTWAAKTPTVFFRTLLIFYVCLVTGLLFSLYRVIRQKQDYWFFFAYFAIGLGAMQLLDNLLQRNVELLEFSLIIIGYFCLRKNKDYLGGCVLCLAAMAKLLPFIFLPYLLIKKRTKAVISFMITFLILAGMAQIILGWENYDLFRSDTLQQVGFPSSAIISGAQYITPVHQVRGSLYTFILSFFAHIDMNSYVPIVTYQTRNFFIPNILFLTLAMVIFLSSLFWFYKNKAHNLLFEFSIVSLMMLLLSPRCNPHYYIFTLFAFFSILNVLSSNEYLLSSRTYLSILLTFMLSLVLMGNLIPLRFYEEIFTLKNNAFHYFSTYGIFGFSTLILWCLMVYLYNKEPQFKKIR